MDTEFIKYPRTYHLPWSEGRTSDDKTLSDTKHFEGKEIVILEKMDGENASIYRGGYHARSLDGRNHWSRSYIKSFQAAIADQIPEGWRICAENMFAKHAIKYDNLESYVLAFSIWNENNICLSWRETVEYFQLMGVSHPPVLYEGPWNEKLVKEFETKLDKTKVEGYVVRLADAFAYEDFKFSCAKFVRKGHVEENTPHWFYAAVEQNSLK